MGDCKYCELVKNKKNILYEDDNLVAVVPEKPLTKGHIRVISKKHHTKIQDIDDKEFQHMFYAASFSATALFENLEAHGTNILFNTGGSLKETGHFHIDVLARKTGDELNFLWTPKKLQEDELKSVQGKIKDKCDMLGTEKKDKKIVNLDKNPKKLESSEELPSEHKEKKEDEPEKKPDEIKKEEKKEDNQESYLIKQLRRIP